MLTLEQVRSRLFKYPGVVDVGIGIKETGNQLTEEVVYRVYVTEKKDKQLLAADEQIPKSIHGANTDVLVVAKGIHRGKRGKSGDLKEYPVLQAGISVGNGHNGTGTPGGFGRLNGTDTYVLLSNHHVLGEGADEGDFVGQPDFKNYCCCCCAYHEKEVGTLLKAIRKELVDCAIAKPFPSKKIDQAIGITNDLTSNILFIKGIDTVVAGETVRKIGANSGFTRGVVVEVGAKVEKQEMINQIHIKPHASETYLEGIDGKFAFSDKGDSGSLVLNQHDKIVGLLWGGTGDLDDTDKDTSFACQIHDVLAALEAAGVGITIENSPDPAPAQSFTKIRAGALASHEPHRVDIRERFSSTPLGSLWLRLFELHNREIMQLVNHNRATGIAWQRNQGPAFMAHFVKSATDETYIIPQAIESITVARLLKAMHTALRAGATEALRIDLDEHAPLIVEYAAGIECNNELLSRISTESFARS